MWRFNRIHIYGVLLLMVAGCSEPEVVIPPLEVNTTGKKVLIEDLTGVRCPNCPSANARLEAIEAIYGENIIIIGVHGELLTRPLAESQYDFRNPSTIALEQLFAPILGKPSAVINRKIHPEFNMLANPLQDQWQTIVERELQLPQQLILEMDIFPTNSGFQINIGILPQEDLGSGFKIHCLITENNILDAQEDVDKIIDNYEHNHVLRNIITPLEGTEIQQSFTKNTLINTSISIENDQILPLTVIDNIEVVVFITDEAGSVEEVSKVTLQ